MMPSDVGVVDLMIGFPNADPRKKYASLRDWRKMPRARRWNSRRSTCSRTYPTDLDQADDP